MAKGEKISKKEARKWVKNYKEKHEKDVNFLSSMLFNKKIVESLLSEEGCEGLRVYNAMDDAGKLHFILVATDAAGNNILPDTDDYGIAAKTIDQDASGGAILVNDGAPCPGSPGCPKDI
jgi:hypothetical protein